MKTSLLSQKMPFVAIIGWLLLYYVTGEISEILTPPNAEISVVWFPAGVATTAFLCMHKRQWPILLFGFIVLNLFLDGFDSEAILISVLYSILGVLSCIVIAWIVRKYAHQDDDLHIILLWLFTIIIVSLLDAVLFSVSMYWLDHTSIKNIFWDGFIADITGNIFATTVMMGLINTRFKTITNLRMHLIWGVVVLGLLIMSTILIFNDSAIQLYNAYFHHQRNLIRLSLLCIPVLFAVILSLLWGNRGGSLALLVLATITIYYTSNRQGPFYLHGLFRHESLWLIQGYLTVISLLMVFLRVVTRSTQRIDENQGIYTRQHLVYQLNLSDGTIEWGNSNNSIPDTDITACSNIKQLIEAIHPEDQEKLNQHWYSQQHHAVLPTILFRFADSDGHWWTIEDRGSVFFGSSDPMMVVGNWFISSEVS